MADDTPGNCESCLFWEQHDGPRGVCRRHAPTPLMRVGIPYDATRNADWRDAVWPTTDEGDWCGEYRPVEKDLWDEAAMAAWAATQAKDAGESQ